MAEGGAVSRRNARLLVPPLCAALLTLGGCQPTVTEPPPTARAPGPVISHSVARPSPSQDVIPPDRQANPKFSYETEKDRRFADFLERKSGGMVRQAAVGIDRSRKLRVQVDRAVSPDDTLPLTKSILAGARADFPNKAFTLSVYDPQGQPILRAHADAEGGVRYQVVHDEADSQASGPRPSGSAPAPDPLSRPGRSEADREFAAWAEDHGRRYLRYVQADLERNGRLWFGVTRDVKPADVPELTQSLLEGAHKAFPRKEIIATAFDPDGERIGLARLGRDGKVRWER